MNKAIVKNSDVPQQQRASARGWHLKKGSTLPIMLCLSGSCWLRKHSEPRPMTLQVGMHWHAAYSRSVGVLSAVQLAPLVLM